jgi:hypothetical protein
MLNGLGLIEEEDRMLQLRLNTLNPATGHGDTGIGQWLADLRLRQGRYGEAEKLARQILDEINLLEQCGPDSPMAFGTRRIIMETIWKQKQYAAAEEFSKETLDLIKAMERRGVG